SCTVAPATTLAADGVTETVATGTAGTAVTVTSTSLLTPDVVACTCAVPGATPVTEPVEDTVATEPLELVHVTVWPASVDPSAASGSAVSGMLWPTITLAVVGVTVMDETGSVWVDTVAVAVSLTPDEVAMMRATPALTPCTTPPLTEATVGSELLQIGVAELTRRPELLRASALRVACCATATVKSLGRIASDVMVLRL